MNEGHSHHLPSQRGLENRTTANMRLITATRLPAICGVSLASDTVIPTPDGWTTLAEIRAGDSVFDEQGRTSTVSEVSEETEEPAYRVIFGDETSIVAGAHHPWMTITQWNLSPVGRSIYRPGPWDAGCWPITTWELEQLFNRPPDMQQREALHHYIPVAGVLGLPKGSFQYTLGCWGYGWVMATRGVRPSFARPMTNPITRRKFRRSAKPGAFGIRAIPFLPTALLGVQTPIS